MMIVSLQISSDFYNLGDIAVCQLIIFVTMSKQSRRSTSVVREVLKDLIQSQNSVPTTQRKNNSLEAIKLGEAVSFLQRKIERQYSEIQVICEQLSKEISIKEELAMLLGEEREKASRTNQHLTNANKQNAELKKKITKLEKDQGEDDALKAQYEIKLNKYRDLVRKKDELLAKHQQKLQELLKTDRQLTQKDQELKSLRETILKLRAKDENTSAQIQSLKKKQTDLISHAQQKQKQLISCKEQLMFASERINRLYEQNRDLNEDNTRREIQSATILQRLSLKMRDQENQISDLSKRRSVPVEKGDWDLLVYKNELRRVIGSCIKDNNLRRRVQSEVLQVLCEVERSFRSSLSKLISSLQG